MSERDDLRRRLAIAMSDPDVVARMLDGVPMYEEYPFPERQTEMWLRCVEETHVLIERGEMDAVMRSILLPHITEAQMQDAIRQAALANGWLFYHAYDARRSDPGFPDCVCVRNGRVLALELKTQRGRVRPEQRAWLAALDRPPVIVAAVVRPEPKHDGEMSYDDALDLLRSC